MKNLKCLFSNIYSFVRDFVYIGEAMGADSMNELEMGTEVQLDEPTLERFNNLLKPDNLIPDPPVAEKNKEKIIDKWINDNFKADVGVKINEYIPQNFTTEKVDHENGTVSVRLVPKEGGEASATAGEAVTDADARIQSAEGSAHKLTARAALAGQETTPALEEGVETASSYAEDVSKFKENGYPMYNVEHSLDKILQKYFYESWDGGSKQNAYDLIYETFKNTESSADKSTLNIFIIKYLFGAFREQIDAEMRDNGELIIRDVNGTLAEGKVSFRGNNGPHEEVVITSANEEIAFTMHGIKKKKIEPSEEPPAVAVPTPVAPTPVAPTPTPVEAEVAEAEVAVAVEAPAEETLTHEQVEKNRGEYVAANPESTPGDDKPPYMTEIRTGGEEAYEILKPNFALEEAFDDEYLIVEGLFTEGATENEKKLVKKNSEKGNKYCTPDGTVITIEQINKIFIPTAEQLVGEDYVEQVAAFQAKTEEVPAEPSEPVPAPKKAKLTKKEKTKKGRKAIEKKLAGNPKAAFAFNMAYKGSDEITSAMKEIFKDKKFKGPNFNEPSTWDTVHNEMINRDDEAGKAYVEAYNREHPEPEAPEAEAPEVAKEPEPLSPEVLGQLTTAKNNLQEARGAGNDEAFVDARDEIVRILKDNGRAEEAEAYEEASSALVSIVEAQYRIPYAQAELDLLKIEEKVGLDVTDDQITAAESKLEAARQAEEPEEEVVEGEEAEAVVAEAEEAAAATEEAAAITEEAPATEEEAIRLETEAERLKDELNDIKKALSNAQDVVDNMIDKGEDEELIALAKKDISFYENELTLAEVNAAATEKQAQVARAAVTAAEPEVPPPA